MAGGIGWADGGVGWKDGGVGWGPGHNPVKPQEPEEPNRFREAENITELIYQMVGAASVCWVGGPGDKVFDDTAARETAEAGLARLAELGVIPREHTDT